MDINIERLKSGNEAVFRDIVTSFWIRLYKFASIYTMDKEVAKEITQDCFLALWEKRETLTDDTCLTTFLLVVSRNKCLDYLRKKQNDLISLDAVNEEMLYLQNHCAILEDDASDMLLAADLTKILQDAIAQLPEKTRLIFRKSREEGKMNKEIAMELGLSVKTVEFHISKALQLLRHDLDKKYFSVIIILLIASFLKK